MRHRKAQKCIQLYNSLASVFVHYEEVYHYAWFNYVPQVSNNNALIFLIPNKALNDHR